MFMYFPNYTHIVPNLNPGLIFGGFIFERIFELVYKGPIFGGGSYSGFYDIL